MKEAGCDTRLRSFSLAHLQRSDTRCTHKSGLPRIVHKTISLAAEWRKSLFIIYSAGGENTLQQHGDLSSACEAAAEPMCVCVMWFNPFSLHARRAARSAKLFINYLHNG
jgi:hypothetical protein